MGRLLCLDELQTLQAARSLDCGVDVNQERLDAYKRAKALEALSEARAALKRSGTYRTAKAVSNG